MRKHRFALALLAILAVALGLRVGYVLALQDRPLSGDGYSYSLAATALADGKGFIDPLSPDGAASAHHPPAWTILLAVPSALGARSILSHQLFAAFVGTAAVAAVAAAARHVGSRRTALIACGVAAIYPGLWMYEWAVLSETLLFLAAALVTLAAYRFRESPGLVRAAVLGLACGAAALVRSEQLLLLAVLVLPLMVTALGIGRRALTSLLVAGGAAVLLIAPWSLYNRDRIEEPVILSTGFGAAQVQGNCDTVYSGPLMGYYDFGCLGPGIEAAVERGAEDPFADAELRTSALEYQKDHLGRLPVVVAARQGRTWSVFRPFATADLEATFALSQPGVHRLGLLAYWALLVPAAAGAVLLHRRRISLLPLLAPVGVAVVTATITYGQPRLRAGAEISLVLLAAVGVERLVARAPWRGRDGPHEGAARRAEVGGGSGREVGGRQGAGRR